MQTEHDELRHARATQDYRVQYTDTIRVSRGEIVHVGHEDADDRGWWGRTTADGRQGGGAVDLLAPAPTAGETAHILADYEATGLPLHRGAALVLEQQRGQWVFARNAAGRRGWVPASHVEPLQPRAPGAGERTRRAS